MFAFFDVGEETRGEMMQGVQQIVDDIKTALPKMKREIQFRSISDVDRILLWSELSAALSGVGPFDDEFREDP